MPEDSTAARGPRSLQGTSWPQVPSEVLQAPCTQWMSPQSRSLMHARRTQTLPVGPSTQLKPEGQGVAVQRVCSQRWVCTSQVSPSLHPETLHPGRQSVWPVQAQARGRHTLPVVAVLQSVSVAQVDGVLLQVPHIGVSEAMQRSGRPHTESSAQHCGCGHPNAGHWNGGALFSRHCAKPGRHEHWKQKSGVQSGFARHGPAVSPVHGLPAPPPAPPASPPPLWPPPA